MTVRELAAALSALPEAWQDLDVFSTADWTVIGRIEADLLELDDHPYVEVSS
jgi:hypothetical protein